MAKLSAYGRKELQRYERWSTLEDPSNGDQGTEVRTEIAVMSDRRMLRKSAWYRDGRQQHASGWSQWKRAKEGYDPVRLQELLESMGYERQT